MINTIKKKRYMLIICIVVFAITVPIIYIDATKPLLTRDVIIFIIYEAIVQEIFIMFKKINNYD